MPRPPQITLTPEQEAYLRAEHAKGTTYSLIAKAMGMSRASFARRVLHLGLQRSSAERFRHLALKKKRVRRRPPRAARAVIVRPPAPPRPVSHCGDVALLDLGPLDCRWIEAHQPPWLFCGKPVAAPGISWCTYHIKRVYSQHRRI